MRILTNNVLESATITNLNASLNYPAENLIHPFLEVRYQPYGATTDTVTFDFADDQIIDCLFLGYHNLTSYVARFYNAAAALLYTITEASPKDIEYKQFGQLSTVRAIEIDLVFPGAGTPYLGGVGAGAGVQIPYFESDYDLPVSDSSEGTVSPGGHSLQIRGAILRQHEFSWPDATIEEKDAFMVGYREAGLGKAVYAAVFNEGVTDLLPLYCRFTDEPKTAKNGRRFDISFELEECR